MNRRWVTASLAMLLLLTIACSSRGAGNTPPSPQTNRKYGSEDQNISAAPSQAPPTTAATAEPRRPSTRSAPSNLPTFATSRPPDPGSTSIKDSGPFGAPIGRAALGRNDITEIVLEFAYVRGYRPSALARDHLMDKLRQFSNKKVSYVEVEMPGGRSSYTAAYIRQYAHENRTKRSSQTQAAFWIGYFDGGFAEADAAGVAVAGTVSALFPESIPAPSDAYARSIERTVLTQEVAHNLGLVNIGYSSPRDHESPDPDYKHHSKNPNSVMYGALITTRGMTGVIARGGAFPYEFDADDAADLQDLAAGRL